LNTLPPETSTAADRISSWRERATHIADVRVSHSSVEEAISVNRKANRSVVVSRLDNKSGSWLRIRNSNPASSGDGSTPNSSRRNARVR
jgi:hypothetical protein